MYQHKDWQGNELDLPAGKVVCVGRNYLDHIEELANEIPDSALLFIKPSTSLADVCQPIVIPTDRGPCHNELEIAVLIKQPLCHVTAEQARACVFGYGLGIDLTLRAVQDDLRGKGLPWEKAKAFDYSCPLSGFVPAELIPEPEYLRFDLHVDSEHRQQGNAELMMRPVFELLSEISSHFTLLPGDVVMTGTPKGVGPLDVGQQLRLSMGTFLTISTSVVAG